MPIRAAFHGTVQFIEYMQYTFGHSETVSRSSLARLELGAFKFEVDPTCGGKLYKITLAHLDSRPLWQYEIAQTHSDSITQSCGKGWQLVLGCTDPFRFYKPGL
jgi:hypothetical protein